MATFGLLEAGWSFHFDRAKRRFGVCRFERKEISVSIHLVRLNDPPECEDTVLHEIAHALAGPRAGHGPRWRAACMSVGARPQRCYSSEGVAQPAARFSAECPSCGTSRGFHRRPSRIRACPACCKKYAGGRFDPRFTLRILETTSGRDVGYAVPSGSVVGQCPSCDREYVFRNRVRSPRACGACCKTHAGGRFDNRFQLVLKQSD
jgi:ribosomal protein L37AE/L43A